MRIFLRSPTAVFVFSLFLPACATTAIHGVRPDGLSQYYITCLTGSVHSDRECENKADQICRGDYSIVSDTGVSHSWLASYRNLTIVCGNLADQTNPFKKFFDPRPGGPVPEGYADPFYGKPSLQVVQEAENREAFRNYLRNNFDFIGQSCFEGTGNLDTSSALNLPTGVKDVAAVLVTSRMIDSRVQTKVISKPTMTMNTATVNSFGSWPVYGNGLSLGEQNIPVQETVTKMGYCSYYFVKVAKTPVFGVFPRELNDSEKNKLNTHRGVVIDVLIKDSPAYLADLFEGDIITSLNGVSVSPHDFLERVNALSGKNVEVQYLRKFKIHKKKIRLN